MTDQREEAARTIEVARREAPDAVRLAELASLATFVDGDLLRALRLEVARDVDVGAEADLWFGPLVESRGVGGIELSAGVAAILRERLARDPAKLAAVRRVLEDVHRSLAPELQVEERANALALAGGTAALEEIEEALRPLVPRVLGPGDDVEALCRWALRAAATFHPVVRQAEAAQLLVTLAAWRLGRASVVREPLPDRVSLDALGWALAAARVAERVEIGVLRVEAGIRFVDPGGGLVLRLPATDPLVVQLEWDHGRRTRLVEAARATTVALAGALDDIAITTLAGERYRLRAAAPVIADAPPEPAPGPPALLAACVSLSRVGGGPTMGVAFAVGPGLLLTAAAAVSELRVVAASAGRAGPELVQLDVLGAQGGQRRPLQYRVTAPSLNLRTGPSTDDRVMGALRRDDVVEWVATSADGRWLRVRKGELEGWCALEFLTRVAEVAATSRSAGAAPVASPSQRPRASAAGESEVVALAASDADRSRWPVTLRLSSKPHREGRAFVGAVDASGPRWVECAMAVGAPEDRLRRAVVMDPPPGSHGVDVAALLGGPVVVEGEVIGAVVEVRAGRDRREANVGVCRLDELQRVSAAAEASASSRSGATAAQRSAIAAVLGTAPRAAVRALALDSRGRLLFAGTGDGLVRVREVATTRLLATLPGESPVTALAVLAGARSVVTATAGGGLFLWDLRDERVVRALRSGRAPVLALAVTPDGRVAGGAADGTLSIWDVERGELLFASASEHRDAITGLRVADEATLVSGSLDGRVVWWSLQTGAVKAAHDLEAGVLSISASEGFWLSPERTTPERRPRVAAGTIDGGLYTWTDPESPAARIGRQRSPVRALEVMALQVLDQPSSSPKLELRSHHVVLAADEEAIHAWSEEASGWTVQTAAYVSDGRPVTAMTSFTGGFLATGSGEGPIAMFDSARLLRVIGAPRVHVVATSADERFAAPIRRALGERFPGDVSREISGAPSSATLAIDDGPPTLVDAPRPEVLVVVVGPGAVKEGIAWNRYADPGRPLRAPLRAVVPVLVGGSTLELAGEPASLRGLASYAAWTVDGDPPSPAAVDRLAMEIADRLDGREAPASSSAPSRGTPPTSPASPPDEAPPRGAGQVARAVPPRPPKSGHPTWRDLLEETAAASSAGSSVDRLRAPARAAKRAAASTSAPRAGGERAGARASSTRAPAARRRSRPKPRKR